MSFFSKTPSANTWTVDKIGNLKGKVYVVTGGYGGIGLETAHQLLKKGAKVYIMGRSKTNYDSAIVQLKLDVEKPDVHFIELDLADLESVKKAANEFLRLEDRLDVLLNNAGVFFASVPKFTSKQGYEPNFAVNTLGHYYLTRLLLPLLEKTGSIDSHSPARVVDVVSHEHQSLPNDQIIVYDSFKGGDAAQKLGARGLYGQSKAGTILWSQAYSRKYKGEKVIFTTLHPGLVNTSVLRDYPVFVSWITGLFFKNAKDGAVASLFAITDLDTKKLNGAYLLPGPEFSKAKEQLYQTALQEEFLKWLDSQVAEFDKTV